MTINPDDLLCNYVIVDVESTGINQAYDLIFELGAILVGKDKKGNVIQDKFIEYIKIPQYKIAICKQKIGNIVKIDVEKIYKARPFSEVFSSFINKIKNFNKRLLCLNDYEFNKLNEIQQCNLTNLFFVAHNANFDYNIIKNNMLRFALRRDKYYYYYLFEERIIDTVI